VHITIFFSGSRKEAVKVMRINLPTFLKSSPPVISSGRDSVIPFRPIGQMKRSL